MICPFICLYSYAQEKSFINHSERKFSSDVILLPNEKFDSKIFRIYIPNDIYDSGSISLIKPRIKQIKFNSAHLKFEKYSYKTVNYCMLQKKEKILDEFFQLYKEKNPQLLFNKKQEGNLLCMEIAVK